MVIPDAPPHSVSLLRLLPSVLTRTELTCGWWCRQAADVITSLGKMSLFLQQSIFMASLQIPACQENTSLSPHHYSPQSAASLHFSGRIGMMKHFRFEACLWCSVCFSVHPSLFYLKWELEGSSKDRPQIRGFSLWFRSVAETRTCQDTQVCTVRNRK